VHAIYTTNSAGEWERGMAVNPENARRVFLIGLEKTTRGASAKPQTEGGEFRHPETRAVRVKGGGKLERIRG